MEPTTIYYAVMTVVSGLLFSTWRKSDLLNFSIKIMFLVLMVWSGILLLANLGYIIKV